jgi:PQ loop repeat
MMLLWAGAGVPLGVYNIVENFNIALQIQPQILTSLSLVTWAQCKYYSHRWPWTKTLGWVLVIALSMGGIESGLIVGLRRSSQEGTRWLVTLMAVLAAMLLCAGVSRHYWDIWKTRTVRGISFWFVGIDALGDLTSLISVFFQPELDVLGMVVYGSELALWLGVFACGGILNFRPWLRNKVEQHDKDQVASRSVELGEDGNVTEGARSTALNGVNIHRTSSASSSTVFRTASTSVGDEEGSERI